MISTITCEGVVEDRGISPAIDKALNEAFTKGIEVVTDLEISRLKSNDPDIDPSSPRRYTYVVVGLPPAKEK